jgi:hypothetical protein
VGIAFLFVVAFVGTDPWDIRIAGMYYAAPLLAMALTVALACVLQAARGSSFAHHGRSARTPLIAGLLLQGTTALLVLVLPLDYGPPPVPFGEGWFWLVATFTLLVLPTAFYVLGLLRAVRAQRMLDAWFALLLIAPAGAMGALQLTS